MGFVDGKPAGVNVAALHTVRVGGRDYRIHAFAHLRILPEHQKKGLWGAINRVFDEKYTEEFSNTAYVSVDNAATLRGFAGAPRWSQHQIRAQLSCAPLAGPQIGRPATPRRAPHRRDSQRDSRTRRDVPAVHRRVIHGARRAFAARLQLGPGADDGSRAGGSVAGWRHGAIRSSSRRESRRIAARSPRSTGDFCRARKTTSKLSCARNADGSCSRPRSAVGFHVGGVGRLRARACVASELERYVVISFGIPEPPGAATRGLRGSDLLLGSAIDATEDDSGTGTQAGRIAPEPINRITEHLDENYIQPGKIVGCQTLVARHGHVAYFKSQGLRDRERRTPMADDTVFRLYSMTKPITSVAIHDALRAGSLPAQRSVSRFIPSWREHKVWVSGEGASMRDCGVGSADDDA